MIYDYKFAIILAPLTLDSTFPVDKHPMLFLSPNKAYQNPTHCKTPIFGTLGLSNHGQLVFVHSPRPKHVPRRDGLKQLCQVVLCWGHAFVVSGGHIVVQMGRRRMASGSRW
ncbi:hypothetical protein FOXYSP1_11208 [Fusarium oxysporum f. sp. phaseoli]